MTSAITHLYSEVNRLWKSGWTPHHHLQHCFYGKRHFQKWVTEFWNTTSQQVGGNWAGGAVTRTCSQWTVCHHGQLFSDHWTHSLSSKEEEEEGRRRRRRGKKWEGTDAGVSREERAGGGGEDNFSTGRYLLGSRKGRQMRISFFLFNFFKLNGFSLF